MSRFFEKPPEVFYCNKCGVKFDDLKAGRWHQAQLCGFDFECGECGKEFNNIYKRDKHQESCGSNKKKKTPLVFMNCEKNGEYRGDNKYVRVSGNNIAYLCIAEGCDNFRQKFRYCHTHRDLHLK